jgi:hydrogenase maturation protease
MGLGNPLMGDDGAGLAALSRLREGWDLEDAELVDGGTWGLNLLPLVESFERVIVLDAVRAGTRPGTLAVLREGDLPRYFAQKLSPHQIDLREVLALAELRGRLPATLAVIGVEPERIDFGAGLSPAVAAAIDGMVGLSLDMLRELGHDGEPVIPDAAFQDAARCMS